MRTTWLSRGCGNGGGFIGHKLRHHWATDIVGSAIGVVDYAVDLLHTTDR